MKKMVSEKIYNTVYITLTVEYIVVLLDDFTLIMYKGYNSYFYYRLIWQPFFLLGFAIGWCIDNKIQTVIQGLRFSLPRYIVIL